MGDIDRKILTLLRDNARIPVSEIAVLIGVSRATVQKHLDQMEANGTICGYTVRTRQVPEINLIRAWMSIAIEGNKAPKIIQQLQGEPAIATLHTTNGRWDVLVEIHTSNLAEFDKVLGGIRRIPGVANTETSILLSTRKM
ncbi:Lrp/AsnC family transcriptional regulator [Enterobacter sp. ABFQC]|uniref:Lrp/AsnC family transcriptional regulator n=1 Tax=Enterobacter sp. ABFQC TaxID=1778656 RepID=UPI00136D10C0|nr:Lrp/AsnC family transcriptional regulator [Enterobacter sp. ABFQC]MXV05450.1 AsnC family transcriptional regulator [Enterobacter sp. ABFQC]